MLLRLAIISDVENLRLCAEEAFSPYISAVGKRPAPMDAQFGEQVSSNKTHVAINSNGELSGYIVFFPQENHMLLESLAVRKSARGLGLGKRLIQHCEQSARYFGLDFVRLYTNEFMEENLSLYPHLGYKETHRSLDDGFHRVYFEKYLVQPT